MLNLLQAKQEDKKVGSMEKTCHYFEVLTKNVYEVLKGEKYSRKTAVKQEIKTEPACPKQPIKKRRIKTTLLTTPSQPIIEDE